MIKLRSRKEPTSKWMKLAVITKALPVSRLTPRNAVA
jgi:hypothetical protein